MTDLRTLRARAHSLRVGLERRVGEAHTLAARGKAVQAEVAELDRLVADYGEVVAVLASIGEERQVRLQQQVESLVTRGLRTIFGEELSFHLVQGSSGRVPSVDFMVRTTLSDGREVDTDLMSARGGGLVSVVSFLLRLVVLLLSRKGQGGLLVLDETFAMLSREYVPLMAAFVRELVDKTGVKVLMVTHQEGFVEQADRAWAFELRDGWTHVRAL